jgi:hypothetical protein
MRLAWEIRRQGIAFGEAIKKAWRTLRLKIQLGKTDEKGTWIAFEKEDGEIRRALATRTLEHIPTQFHPKKADGATSGLVVKFFDILKDGWRSFRADRLIITNA